MVYSESFTSWQLDDFSLTVDNFLMSLSDSSVLRCLAQVFGYLPVPIMDTNLDVIARSSIPVEMQGRVYSCRNTLQFFTIPLGTFLGGFLIDKIFEPLAADASSESSITRLFGSGKGAGAGIMIFLLGAAGLIVCICFMWALRKYKFEEK